MAAFTKENLQMAISPLVIVIEQWYIGRNICFWGQGIQLWQQKYDILCPTGSN